MKLIIAGSRNIPDKVGLTLVYRSLTTPLFKGITITEIVTGGAKGLDRSGIMFAEKRGLPIKYFWPQYHKYGGRAPIIRNTQMADYADGLLLIWDGISKGSEDMFKKAKLKGLPVWYSLFIESDHRALDLTYLPSRKGIIRQSNLFV